ncbi:hypothetical protein MKW98_012180 [Papaver atlanticum]|uniref:Uncharacterized protein n=1 Tax=Papaver atlanticum TaxID=357466 RepID=A0AAD4XPJ6_9MAGN|nr:hypothetical protein MKW98_012180 [Papaver atlanticum]
MELPECPVCLQIYSNEKIKEEEDEEERSVVPRVLSCGHSACESCLTRLPQRYSNTIRCPACTQLVHFPPQGPSSLPKNIDLLSFIEQHNKTPNPSSSSSTTNSQVRKQHDFIPGLLWSDDEEFYSNWKDWILPNDLLSIKEEQNCKLGDEEFLSLSLYQARVSNPLKRWCFDFRAGQTVSLLYVVSSSSFDSSVNDKKIGVCKLGINFSYNARVMEALKRLREEERAELSLILSASFRQLRVCKVYGLWMNSNDGSVFLVCQHSDNHLTNKLLCGGLRKNCISGDEEDKDETIWNVDMNEETMSGFALVGMDLCEALIGLHNEGVVCGYLALSCFTYDCFGHICVDQNGVLVMGRRVQKGIAEIVATSSINGVNSDELLIQTQASFDSVQAFVSPEVLLRLFNSKGTVAPDIDSLGYSVGYGSDVWSLACILILLLLGDPIAEGLFQDLYHHLPNSNKEKCDKLLGVYNDWMERTSSKLGSTLSTKYASLHQILHRCLDFNPGVRPQVIDVLMCIRELISRPRVDISVNLVNVVDVENETVHCLTLGFLCDFPKEVGRELESQENGYEVCEVDQGGVEFGQVRDGTCERDAVKGMCIGKLKAINLQGHIDCITGFAVGGGFLFSTSFDKTVNVWSLQNFSHMQSLKGHEHRVMAVVFVDAEKPLCISGDSGGGIFVWQVCIPLAQEPLKKWFELKDWRYSGIHALAVSGTEYLYTGSGDKSIKVWSLQDYTLTCTMNGHNSVVSSLAVCDGVLYSGSWDGTIRLWAIRDHSPLAVLGDNTPGSLSSVLSLSVEPHMIVAAYESGCVKVWWDDVLSSSIQTDSGANLALVMDGRWLFMGGWNKTVNVQELSGDELRVNVRPIGSIPCDSVVTALTYWEGKLYVGFADSAVKVYYYEA